METYTRAPVLSGIAATSTTAAEAALASVLPAAKALRVRTLTKGSE